MRIAVILLLCLTGTAFGSDRTAELLTVLTRYVDEADPNGAAKARELVQGQWDETEQDGAKMRTKVVNWFTDNDEKLLARDPAALLRLEAYLALFKSNKIDLPADLDTYVTDAEIDALTADVRAKLHVTVASKPAP